MTNFIFSPRITKKKMPKNVQYLIYPSSQTKQKTVTNFNNRTARLCNLKSMVIVIHHMDTDWIIYSNKTN